MSERFHDGMTLSEAREILRDLVDEGHKCPLCTQFAKVYKRKLPSASARVLVALHRAGAFDEYAYLPDILDRMTGTAHQGGYGTLSVHWGLIERKPGIRDDGSERVGWWRLTLRGTEFVERRISVPSHARLYDGRCLGLIGGPLGIEQALGTRFDYRELMYG